MIWNEGEEVEIGRRSRIIRMIINLLSPSICQASATTLSLSPLLAEIVTISGCIERGSMTLNVCDVVDDERVISGV